MDEALELADYLPLSFKTQSEGEYVAFLWGAFESNYTSGKYEFASLAFHLLYMSFVSFSICQIRVFRSLFSNTFSLTIGSEDMYVKIELFNTSCTMT